MYQISFKSEKLFEHRRMYHTYGPTDIDSGQVPLSHTRNQYSMYKLLFSLHCSQLC